MAAGGIAAGVITTRLVAQQANTGAANVPMDENRYIPVQRPPKSTTPSMDELQRDAVERRLHCQCGCNLDVFTCRTTDFSCQVSPAMHQDVMALVAGGYTGPEIIKAFVDTYGERVLMEPEMRGFNLAGYFLPFVALAGGVVLVITLLRRWYRPDGTPAVRTLPIEATPEELAKLDALVRHDDA